MRLPSRAVVNGLSVRWVPMMDLGSARKWNVTLLATNRNGGVKRPGVWFDVALLILNLPYNIPYAGVFLLYINTLRNC